MCYWNCLWITVVVELWTSEFWIFIGASRSYWKGIKIRSIPIFGRRFKLRKYSKLDGQVSQYLSVTFKLLDVNISNHHTVLVMSCHSIAVLIIPTKKSNLSSKLLAVLFSHVNFQTVRPNRSNCCQLASFQLETATSSNFSMWFSISATISRHKCGQKSVQKLCLPLRCKQLTIRNWLCNRLYAAHCIFFACNTNNIYCSYGG